MRIISPCMHLSLHTHTDLQFGIIRFIICFDLCSPFASSANENQMFWLGRARWAKKRNKRNKTSLFQMMFRFRWRRRDSAHLQRHSTSCTGTSVVYKAATPSTSWVLPSFLGVTLDVWRPSFRYSKEHLRVRRYHFVNLLQLSIVTDHNRR